MGLGAGGGFREAAGIVCSSSLGSTVVWLVGCGPQVGQDGVKVELQKASITLTDCLACSGCVTSAESVLVEMQNYRELEQARQL